MSQLHKKFSNDQIKNWFERYLRKEVERKIICQVLDINRSRFFDLLQKFRQAPDQFSIAYQRKSRSRIPAVIERNILKELKADKQLIINKDVPLSTYNYSFVKKRLSIKYRQDVSLNTIIRKAKENGYYKTRRKQKRLHDREVLTSYVGELIQHDASYHLWAPDSGSKWYLISSLDDHSRFILYAKLLERESRWEHVLAVKYVVLKHGTPLRYYTDCHSIFRFVQGRDSNWRKHYLLTDDVDTQWKQVLDDCNIKVTYALSPQAKGKVERSYRWLQDNLIRLCAREHIRAIADAQKLLDELVDHYNYRQIHSTIRETPYARFERCKKIGMSLFQTFIIKKPYLSIKDIFCIRINRQVDGYRKVSINNFSFRIPNAILYDEVNLRIYNNGDGTSEIRCWYKDQLLEVKTIKTDDLKI